MEWVVFAVVGAVLVVFAVVAQIKGWIDLSNKNARQRGGGVMVIGDEVFHPAKHEARIELDRQTELPAPAPVPGDGDRDIYRGNVRIDLTQGRSVSGS